LQIACLNISWVPPLCLRQSVKQLRPNAFTAFFNQTLRLTNKGKGLDLNDSFLDQAFPRLPIFGIIQYETEQHFRARIPIKTNYKLF
jgi:hypothetical protein